MDVIDRPQYDKQDLQRWQKSARPLVAKLSKPQNVSMDVLIKICTALRVNAEDIWNLLQTQEFKNSISRIMISPVYGTGNDI